MESVISEAETPYLDEAKIDALRPPKQDRATAMGMVQLNTPKVWSANVWGQNTEGALSTGQGFKSLRYRGCWVEHSHCGAAHPLA